MPRNALTYLSPRAAARKARRTAPPTAPPAEAVQPAAPKPSRAHPGNSAAGRAFEEGKAADIAFFTRHPWRRHSARPLGNAELGAILRIFGRLPPPGIRRPAMRALMLCSFDPEDRTIRRTIRTAGITPREWRYILHHAGLGRWPSEEIAEDWHRCPFGGYILLGYVAIPSPPAASGVAT